VIVPGAAEGIRVSGLTGWLDIYLVNGSTYDAPDGKAEPTHAALFHNNHDGTFTNVAQIAGVTNDRWGFGVAVGDFDNDGWPDIYVGNYAKNRLYRNNHDGTFHPQITSTSIKAMGPSRVQASTPVLPLTRMRARQLRWGWLLVTIETTVDSPTPIPISA
jgi:hypothetical protein